MRHTDSALCIGWADGGERSGFVRQFRPQLFVTSDRSPNASRSMIVSSDRRVAAILTQVIDLGVRPLLAGAMDPELSAAVTSREHPSLTVA
jgi:hypothetical protein